MLRIGSTFAGAGRYIPPKTLVAMGKPSQAVSW